MNDFLISMLAVIIGCGLWLVVFVAIEFHHIQRGHSSFEIFHILYNKIPWFRKIN